MKPHVFLRLAVAAVFVLMTVSGAMALNQTHEDNIRGNLSGVRNQTVDDLIDILEDIDESVVDDDHIIDLVVGMRERTLEDMITLFEDMDERDVETLLDFFYDLSDGEVEDLLEILDDLTIGEAGGVVTDTQLFFLFDDLRDDLINATSETCAQPVTIAEIENLIERKFRDVTDRIENTLLPSKQSEDELKERALVAEKDLGICEQSLVGERVNHQNLIERKDEQIESIIKDKQTWMYVASGLGILLILIIVRPWWKARGGV